MKQNQPSVQWWVITTLYTANVANSAYTFTDAKAPPD